MFMIRGTITIIWLAAMGYYIYVPMMPDITQEPVKLSLILSCRKLIQTISKIGESIGFGPKHNITRKLQAYHTYEAHSTDSVEVKSVVFDGVRTLLYEPKGRSPDDSAAIIFIHGGGFIYNSPESYHRLTLSLAATMQVVVISIDYRLAPEFPYPIPFNDCLKATLEFFKQTSKYGVNPRRIAIIGESAGGNLAAAVTLKLHSEKDLPKLKLQVLLYPRLQSMDFNTPSYLEYQDSPIISKDDSITSSILYLKGKLALPQMHNLMEHAKSNQHINTDKLQSILSRIDSKTLLPESLTKDHTPLRPAGEGHPDLSHSFTAALQDPHHSPLTGASDALLRTLPPAYIVTCRRDVLRDEGLMYMARLKAVGARVLVHKEYDFIHGLFSFFHYNIPESISALDDLVTYLQKNAIL